MPPCLIYEDEHLLVVNKPAGLNTHAPGPFTGEGIYEWLRHRESRWSRLAIIHRLDKETSGVLVFSKTPLANRSLTAQFTTRTVRKRYRLLTDRSARPREIVVKSALVRAGAKYVSRPRHRGAEAAETRFREFRSENEQGGGGGRYRLLEAEPVTGRTHQIRVHAAEAGIPILGDTLYGGTPAERVFLHAAELALRHPASGEEIIFRAPLGDDWPAGSAGISVGNAPAAACAGRNVGAPVESTSRPLPHLALRSALIDARSTDAYRLIHGAADGWPGWYVDRLGTFLLSQGARDLTPAQNLELERLVAVLPARGAYHKILKRQAGRAAPADASPRRLLGAAAPERFPVRENGLQFELSFGEGYSVGLFLDQRDNRRRLLTGHLAADFPLLASAPGDRRWEILNVFAYTCAFSVCAAKAGARTTNLDLSRRWLDWGKRNFLLNGLDPATHDFVHGDAFDWLRRLAKKQRLFDVVVLDPPTFSQSKEGGVFRAEKDFERLVVATLPLLKPGGVLFASTNAADWPPEKFLATMDAALRAVKRSVVQKHYFPQPPDFPVSRAEPAYLKTVWLRLA